MANWLIITLALNKHSSNRHMIAFNLLTALFLTLALNACGPPTDSTAPAKDAEITSVVETKGEETIAPTPKSMPSPEPTDAPQPAPEEPLIWVYLTASGILVFEHPDDSVIATTDLDVPIDPWLGLPDTTRYVTLAGNEVFYTEMDLIASTHITVVSPDGTARIIRAPTSTGELVDVLPSPNAVWIAWLFDATEVKPTFDGCDPTSGCIGRVYNVVLTDSTGGNGASLWSIVLDEPYPLLEIDSWSVDESTIYFRRVPWGIASAYYLPMGGGIISVSVNDGSAAELSSDFIGLETAISPDGRWMARGGYGEGKFSLTVDSIDGTRYTIPFVVGFQPISAQMKFSPDSDQLAWIEILTEGDGSLTLKTMALTNGEPKTVRTLEAPIDQENMPHIGTWLSDDILVINDRWGSRLLDLTTGEWMIRARPIGAEANVVLGLIAP